MTNLDEQPAESLAASTGEELLADLAQLCRDRLNATRHRSRYSTVLGIVLTIGGGLQAYYAGVRLLGMSPAAVIVILGVTLAISCLIGQAIGRRLLRKQILAELHALNVDESPRSGP